MVIITKSLTKIHTESPLKVYDKHEFYNLWTLYQENDVEN